MDKVDLVYYTEDGERLVIGSANVELETGKVHAMVTETVFQDYIRSPLFQEAMSFGWNQDELLLVYKPKPALPTNSPAGHIAKMCIADEVSDSRWIDNQRFVEEELKFNKYRERYFRLMEGLTVQGLLKSQKDQNTYPEPGAYHVLNFSKIKHNLIS